MRRIAFAQAGKRALREKSWSILIIAIMSLGLTGWMTIPSIGTSLQSGVQGYANAVATYVVVQNNGNPSTLNQTLPQSMIEQFGQIPGVSKVYPIVTNYTIFFFSPPRSDGSIKVGNRTIAVDEASLGILSAVVGGIRGYPPNLLDLASGSAPSGNEAGFVYNSDIGNPLSLGNSTKVQIANINFTATEVGINKYVPLIGNNLGVLWNNSFMESVLGTSLLDKTFGGGANFVIIKTTSAENVPAVVSSLKSLLGSYQSYIVIYDQATVNNLLSLEQGTAPLYELLGVVSLSFAVLAVFVVSYVAINRRSWEAGLLLTQGWSWDGLRAYFFSYLLILGVLSFGVSVLASAVIGKYTGSTYQVYGGYQVITVKLGVEYVLIAGVIVVVLAIASAIFSNWRLRKVDLDGILREF
jgi:ABC-type lipoprotein release transport system permease subunit